MSIRRFFFSTTHFHSLAWSHCQWIFCLVCEIYLVLSSTIWSLNVYQCIRHSYVYFSVSLTKHISSCFWIGIYIDSSFFLKHRYCFGIVCNCYFLFRLTRKNTLNRRQNLRDWLRWLDIFVHNFNFSNEHVLLSLFPFCFYSPWEMKRNSMFCCLIFLALSASFYIHKEYSVFYFLFPSTQMLVGIFGVFCVDLCEQIFFYQTNGMKTSEYSECERRVDKHLPEWFDKFTRVWSTF